MDFLLLSFMKQTFQLGGIENIASEILLQLGDRKVVAFKAGMGVGKTTIIVAICRLLGVSSAMSSPTFSIINEYANVNGEPIYHLDLYRIKSREEAIAAGVEDVLHSGNICFVEWPQVVADLLPLNTMHITMTLIKDGERLIEINSNL